MKHLLLLGTFLILLTTAKTQVTVSILPTKDNSIYSEDGSVSNGEGKLFSGRTNNGDLRRALLYFDIAANVPAGSVITNVTLNLEQDNASPGATSEDFNLHPLTTDWGEGTSSGSGQGASAVAPDATWTDAMLGTSTWTNPGGDYLASVAQTTVGAANGLNSWSSADMITNVQAWLDNPASNFGWILIGDEINDGSARRFGSKDQGTAPLLEVEYTCSTPPTAICKGRTIYIGGSGTFAINGPGFNEASVSNCGGNLTYSASQNLFTCADIETGPVPDGLVLSAVFDGDITGGLPKGIELYAYNYIPDLSVYGVGSANNGGGTDGEEFTFPAVEVNAGTYIYVASEAVEFENFFGFAPDYTSGVVNINGDDAVELFKDGSVIDVFGDINTDGTGEPWEYTDGWAYRNASTGPDGTTFSLGDWSFNDLSGETVNSTAANPVPIASFTKPSSYGTDVTLTVTDQFNNTNTCVSNVIVLDTMAPTVNCLSNPSFNLDTNGELTLTPADLDDGTTDNCGIQSLSLSRTNFSCLDVASTLVTLYAEDSYGNIDSCVTNVTIDGSNVISIDSLTVEETSCFDACDGSIEVHSVNTTNYSIDAGANFQSDQLFTGLCAGTYDIIVESASECVETTQTTVLEPSEIVYTANVTDLSCFEANDGEIEINASGGISPYEYSIDNGNNYQTNSVFGSLSAGNYDITIIDNTGCEGPTTSETISEPAAINTSTTINDLTISADLPGANYQWVECPDFDVINGETNQNFTATQNGDYAVIVTDSEGCSDTSECVTINDVSINKNDKKYFSVYPNPSSNEIFIKVSEEYIGSSLAIKDSKGSQVMNSKINSLLSNLSVADLENGVYFIEINAKGGRIIQKVIVQK